MDNSNMATAFDGGDEKLKALHTAVEGAVAFAEEWPSTYREQAFKLAVEQLLSGTDAPIPAGGNGPTPVTPIVTGGLRTVAKDLEVDARLLSRAVEISDEGKVSVLGRIEGRAKADLAVQYAAVLCYVKERALNQLDTPIEELREQAKAHGCYDGKNFTAAFRRSDLLRELGEKGSQARTYRLSAKGLEEAKALLKKMIEE